MRILTFVFAFGLSLSLVTGQEYKTYFDSALVAYEQQDITGYLRLLQQADELRPNHPTITYKLAGAYALNKRRTRAIQTLRQLMLMDATIAFEQDSDFGNIVGRKGYEDLLAFQEEMNRVEEHDEVFVEIDAAEIHPESFVILDDGTLLLGSIRERRIVKVLADGSYVNWLETPYAVMGMKLDEASNVLWVATAAVPEMIDYSVEEQGNSIILEVDLNTGLIIQGLAYDEASLIGDIIPDGEERLWLSNSYEPILTRDDTDTSNVFGAFTRLTFDLSMNFFNLQGLALLADGSSLYFADYIKGLHRIEIETGEIVPVMSSNPALLKGIDGLYFYKNTLIAIHNGTKPYRVMQYFLDEKGTFIDVSRVINRGGATLGEPTLGQLKDGYFYYLANSPWPAYEQGEFNISNWGPIQIRRIKLE
jgi:sugar lactone lactonase YvrE